MGRRKVEDDLCMYCGDIATTRDHVPPKKWLNLFSLHALHLTENKVVVPACRNCNCVLGAKPLFTIEERRAYMRTYLWRKHGKLLATPGWKEEEITQLGRNLQRYIRGELHRKQHVMRRIGMCRW